MLCLEQIEESLECVNKHNAMEKINASKGQSTIGSNRP